MRVLPDSQQGSTLALLRNWAVLAALLGLTACTAAGDGSGTIPPATAVTTTSIAATTTSSETASRTETLVAAGGLEYVSGDERFRGSHELVDVLVPPDLGGPWPVVLVLHGDPLFAGRQWSMPMAWELARQGRVVFVPDWGHTALEWRSQASLREQWDYLVAELRCAVAFTKAIAPEYGGDPDHITVAGYSAGGNAALMAAMSDLEPLDTCVTPGPAVDPQAAVSIEGDLLIGAPAWDQEFADDPETFYSLAPWRLLEPDDRLPVHILAAADTVGAERSLVGADPYTTFLATRHTDIDLIAELDEMDFLDDGIFSNLEAQEWAYRAFLDAGYETTWTVLPDSRHANIGDRNWAMSDQSWQLAVDAILDAESTAG